MKTRRYKNVWDALEDSAGTAANMRLRADLVLAVQDYVTKSEATQGAVIKQLGIRQPRLSDLLRGRIDKFSVDALVVMLARIGKQISIKIYNAA